MNNRWLILLIILLLFCSFNKFTFKELFSPCPYHIVMFLTGGYCIEAENAIKTLEMHNLKDKVIVVCLDKKCETCMKKLNVKTELLNVNVKDSSWGSRDFYNVTKYKYKAIGDILNKYNKDILFMDTDIVILGDIDSDIQDLCKSEYDQIYQCNDGDLSNKCGEINTGFMYIKNNTINKQFCQDHHNYMMSKKHIYDADQAVTNKFLNSSDGKYRNKIKWSTFDKKQYPNGAIYFASGHQKDAKMVHNNFIAGVDKKIERFKKYNLWYI